MRSWPNQKKLLTELRRRSEKQAPTDPLNALVRDESSGPSSDSSSRGLAEFLEFAQAAGGFGAFELNLVTGHIKGTSLFFELIGLECRDMSLTREEWLASIHPEDLESVVHAMGDAVASGCGYETEYRTLTATGEIRWLAGRGQVLLGGEGYDSRAIGTITDITERKALEDKLHDATESLNIAQTAAGVATFDFDLRRNSRICSDNFRELLGIAPATSLEDLNRALSRVHPDDFARVRSAPLETTAADPYYRCEYRVLLEGGSERWIGEKAKVSRSPSGDVERITGAIVDITDRKLAEQASLDAKLTAEAANRAKSSFLANLSHEIRTPMNGVIGMSQILAETPLDNTQREYLDIIRGSAKALLSLINGVLDLSKIEADRLELENVEFDLIHMLYETVAATALQTAAKGIELIVSIEAAVPVMIRADPGRLRQVVLNLLGNAVKFTHEGSITVHLTTELEANDRATLTIEVTDTGIGIPADRLDRLFKSFSQVDSSTTRHYGGTGLGLSIVKRLAELMGGDVGVRSETGKGSTFWVRVKVDVAKQQPVRVAIGLGRRILIVDDLRAAREAQALKLKLYSYETVVVGSVDEALEELAKNSSFDLVLADELMPMRGGLDLLALLRSDGRFARLPLILLSLFGAEHDTTDHEHQPDAIGLKPIRAVHLATLIDQVLTGKTPHALNLKSSPQPKATFRGNKILLVEDNPINQRVAQRTLQNMGAEVTIANNGAEALERIAAFAFDAVLMDCQMPVMDGFTATRRIRELESGRCLKRLPIIALTANVMSEDRENCLAAGMDAHLGKPIEPAQLIEVLNRFLKARAAAPPIDREALRELTGGDAEFERELADTFVSSGDLCLAEIIAALKVSDFDTVRKRAHSLKGASANIHALDLSRAASSLEDAVRANSIPAIGGLVADLAKKLAAVNAELRQAG
jgi:two-component system sensor histidine kinase/response regulator